ncbi:hypothetical protein LguiA_004492 [Lonicera macranthoides]
MIDHRSTMIDHGANESSGRGPHDRSWPGGDSHQLLLFALFWGLLFLDIFP